LIEDTTAQASAAALKQLLVASEPTQNYAPTSGVFRSGTTVEDLVVEALRPMLKEWLDAHLPEVVERLVQREIQKIVATLR
jgi:cell pole-organizing protein PopZ